MALFKGAVALVTGGASGLGKATVERLTNLGSKVILYDLQNSNGFEVAKSLGDVAVFVPGDVSSENDVQAALNLIKKQFGKLDYVINCAGISGRGPVYNFKEKVPHRLKDFSQVFKVNTIGTFNVIRLSAGLIGENNLNNLGERGVIINTASLLAFDGKKNLSAYCASKAAVVSMTLPIARDLSSQAIRVVAIAPGIFDTPMLANSPQKLKNESKLVPFPSRSGHPSEFAHLVQSILENPMLNGETIRLDGAYRMF